MFRINEFGQPIGPALPGWVSPPFPVRTELEGRWCRLEPLDVERHGQALFEELSRDADARRWTYLPYGPFENVQAHSAWLRGMSVSSDPLFFTIVPHDSGRAAGLCSYLRITPASGAIEVGHLNYSAPLQRTPAATEAMYLMMKTAFELGYRRYEWKCDALNAPSRRAALRLGFAFEGIFRQALVYKGRNRDTAWYSIVDGEWPVLRQALESWLAPENFDTLGVQRRSLGELSLPLATLRAAPAEAP
jgi:RimJ/RimL family protein N-acetyltransferase